MKKQFKSKDFHGAAFVVFPTEEKAREFIENSQATPIKYDDGSVLECSLQDDRYKKKESETGASGNDRQARKDKRKEELEKKTNEHLEKLNTETVTGALIHLAGRRRIP